MKYLYKILRNGFSYFGFFEEKHTFYPYAYPPKSLFEDKNLLNRDFINAIIDYESK